MVSLVPPWQLAYSKVAEQEEERLDVIFLGNGLVENTHFGLGLLQLYRFALLVVRHGRLPVQHHGSRVFGGPDRQGFVKLGVDFLGAFDLLVLVLWGMFGWTSGGLVCRATDHVALFPVHHLIPL